MVNSFGYLNIFPSCVIYLTEETRIFMGGNILLRGAVTLMVLLPDVKGELTSNVLAIDMVNFDLRNYHQLIA